MKITEFADHISDPDRYSGGGSVSAAAVAFASALTALVVKLSKKRKKNRLKIDQIDSDLARIQELRKQFLVAIDEDARLLTQLMKLYSNRSPASEPAYTAAIQLAAKEPLALASQTFELLQIIHNQIPLASRFTVADLAAAAAVATAGAHGALLMTDVNVDLLQNRADSDPQSTDLLIRQRTTLSDELSQLNDKIQEATRARFHLNTSTLTDGARQ